MLPFFLKRNLEKIFINDSEIIKRLDKRRESRNIYDKDLLGRPVKCLDLSNKEEIIPDGRLRIDKGSARFECFFSSRK